MPILASRLRLRSRLFALWRKTGLARVSILIVAYKSRAHLPRLFDCLDGQTCQDFETVLIDNASPEGTVPDAGTFARADIFVQNVSNTGFAVANNQAARLASGEWLIMLNPDAFPAPNWLAQLLAASERYPHVTAFGSTQLLDENPSLLDGAGDVYHGAGIPFRGGYLRPIPTDLQDGEAFTPCAAAAMWRADVFKALDGFEESYFCYCEDVDLGFRHRLTGGRTVQVASAVVRHMGSASSGRLSDFAVYHGTRNRLWTFVRCMPGVLFWLMLVPHIAATLLLFAHTAWRGAGAAYGRGLSDGLAALPRVWRQRWAIQKSTQVSFVALLRQFAWSPLSLLTRAIVLRRL
jgi:N-acetylglucosaminyl-diphospho-decaprenol L-rhamnosyltransferase